MSNRIRITDTVSLDPAELRFSYIRSSGPGGQNVNKVASAAQLRFELRRSRSLPDGLKSRARGLAGARLTKDGAIVITASRFRTQPLNRNDAIARLVALLRQAAVPPKRRVKTRPTLASKQRRLKAKTQRGAIKNLRRSKPSFD